MRVTLIAAIAAAATLAGCSSYGTDTRYRGYSAYDYNRADPAYGGYYADRYYADGPRYRERRLSTRDRVYRGQNGQYYCRRNDGTTGLLVGAAAGGVLGNIIAPGGSELLGTLLGGAAGAAVGQSVDRNNVRCR
jgi:outer membrane lipoprotein SlyB